MEKKINSIFIIDDDPMTNLLHQVIIQKTGLTDDISSAESVEEAIGLLNSKMFTQSSIPELILIDLNMPGLNGWDFIVEYSNMVQHSKRKSVIVILTASTHPDDAKKASTIPEIAGFRNKPLTVEMINEIAEEFF
jgi:CheY-like chemotaxis protein